jgi:hypothetical protein
LGDTRTIEVEECGAVELAAREGGSRAALWEWAGGLEATGVRALCSRDETGAPVAGIAALRVPALVEGTPAELLQVLAAWSSGEPSLGLRNPGRFALVAERFARTHGGDPPDGAPLIYGLPTRPFWRLAKERLSAKVMRTQDLLHARADDLALPPAAGVEVTEELRFPEDVLQLKRRAAEGSALLMRPAAADLDRRFVGHPSGAYRIGTARRGELLVGYAVFRPGDLDGREHLGLVWDWCVPGGDSGAGAALLAWVRDCARAAECEELVVVLPDTLPDWVALQDAGLRVRGSRLFVAARHFPRPMTMRWLYHEWSYGLADLVVD